MDSRPTQKLNVTVLLVIVFAAALARLLFLDIPNFAPIAAMALFGGTYLAKQKWLLVVPFLAMFASDVVLQILYSTGNASSAGFHATMIWVYGAIASIVLIGRLLSKRVNILTVTGAALAGSVTFFLVTNFGVWASGIVGCPMNLAGLGESYVAGIPFFHYTLAGDLLFTAILFGGFELLKYRFPKLAYARA